MLFDENKLNYILDCTYNGIIAIDQDGTVRVFNLAAGRLLGMDSKEVAGKPVEQILPNSGLGQVVKSGRSQLGRQVEHNGRRFLSNRTPIIIDGEIVGAVAVFQDISELEKMTFELDHVKGLNKELDAIIEYSQDGICITDAEGRIIRLNRSFETLTNLKPSDYVGKFIQDIVDNHIIDNSAALKVIRSKSPVTVMQNYATGRQLLTSGYPIFDDAGNLLRVVSNLRDLTELNHLREQLEQSNRLTSRYLTELSELRKVKTLETDVVAQSKEMRDILDLAYRVALVDSTILILGESGVGKEVIARIIHRASIRNDLGAFVKINCGAIPRELLESELFGYEPGAFTGASKEGKAGYFELAHHGTLFLDEVAELPLDLQVKLLRVLQEKEIVRLGGTNPIKVDVRIVAATNRNMEEMVARGTFREDLFYRLHVVPIHIPPLRERKDDITVLLFHFLKLFNGKYGFQKSYSNATVEALLAYNWPGNVRELSNLVERLVVTTKEDVILPEHLPVQYQKTNTQGPKARSQSPEDLQTLEAAVEETEREMITAALAIHTTHERAARALGISLSTFARKLRRYKL